MLLTSVAGDPSSGPLTPNTTTTSSTPVTPPPTPVPAAPSKSGLSTGATAGIAVGATLGVVAVAILAWIFYRRRKGSGKIAAPTTETTQVNQTQPAPEPDRTSKALSELHAFPRSPTSPTFDKYGAQPSPGPPHYSPHYDGQAVEMVRYRFILKCGR